MPGVPRGCVAIAVMTDSTPVRCDAADDARVQRDLSACQLIRARHASHIIPTEPGTRTRDTS